MKPEFESSVPASLFTADNWGDAGLQTIYRGDIYHPWHSAHGFSMTAARLAAGQNLVLSCREDEAFDTLARLNNLLERPEVLERAYAMLSDLEQQTFQKLARCLQVKDQPIEEAEIAELVETIERLLTETAEPAVAERLMNELSPDQSIDEITGLRKMLARLQELLPPLEKVKEHGFRVVVRDRRRQSTRPVQEARRHEPVLRNGKPTGLPAGFLQPIQYHLSLWIYLIRRGDRGQSAVWN